MTATLNASQRDKLGSRHARRLRLQGRIPANLQGEDKENLSFSIDEDEFLTARRHHEHVFNVAFSEKDVDAAMVRELQWDPFGERIIHVEFRRVVLDRETEAEVELEFSGMPKGGVLNQLVAHVTVLALPAAIPDKIEFMVGELDLGDKVAAGDLELPEGVRLGMPEDTPVATVAAVRAIEAEVEPEEGEEAAEGEEKPADEDAATAEDKKEDEGS